MGYQTSLQAENHLISLKMSETDAKIENPTSEELKGVKMAADDDVEEIKKQKTENGSSNGKAAEVDAAENGDDVEEEEDIDEEDEENLGEEEEGEEGEEDLDEAEGEEGDDEVIFCQLPTSNYNITTSMIYITKKFSLRKPLLQHKKKRQDQSSTQSSKNMSVKTNKPTFSIQKFHVFSATLSFSEKKRRLLIERRSLSFT